MLNMLTFNPQHLANIWTQFFHAPESTLILAIFRIAFGILLLVNACSLWHAAEYCFHPAGALTIEDQSPAIRKRTWSLFNHLPPTRGTVHFVFLVHFVGVLGLSLGF